MLLDRKMNDIRNYGSLLEQDVIELLAKEKSLYAPLNVNFKEFRPGIDSNYRSDARVTVDWMAKTVGFQAEITTRSAPKMVLDKVLRIKGALTSKNDTQNLLVIVPHLSKSVVEILKQERLSGLDLNGNYFIQTQKMLAVRLDKRNRYRESQLIRKVFSGNSSMVARLFLAGQRKFASVRDVYNGIRELGGKLSYSAVSKVLTRLQEELVIGTSPEGVVLLQADKLLRRLREGYRPPRVTRQVTLKLPGEGRGAVRALSNLINRGGRWVLSGESSLERYAVTTPAMVYTAYVDNPGSVEQYTEKRFYNVVVKQVRDPFPFFNARCEDDIWWSSDVQCYLELSGMDKRERELAESVEDGILRQYK